MENIFESDYCQFITTACYFGVGEDELTEADLESFKKGIAEWRAQNNHMPADAFFEGDKIFVRVGHFSEDAATGMQISIFKSIVQAFGHDLEKSFAFDIKDTVKNPLARSLDD